MRASQDSDGNRLPMFFVDANGCWIWTRSLDRKGYATGRTHRRIWEAFNGPMPLGLQSDHLCRVRCCVNPEHIEAVTLWENNRRSMSPLGINFRKTECKRGHTLSVENTVIKRWGNRECRTCKQARDKIRHARNKALEQAGEK